MRLPALNESLVHLSVDDGDKKELDLRLCLE